MASYTPWLNEHGALVDYAQTAKPPAKDFYQIFVSPSEVVYRLWKIVPPTRPNNHPAPSEVRDNWEDFKNDERLHSEIQRVAGDVTVDWLVNIVCGHLDYLNRLPKNVLTKIILMLDLESLAHLSMTCHLFRELCSSDEIWEKIYKIHNKQPITQELLMLVDQKGWKEVFFTNKLQLQMQMRRVATGKGAKQKK
ncbi:F-box only protein 36-like isoform X2 [Littorina saxatilis]|uniref:F-box domain-containing protein n=1 Tax=Littorina saxatilis TaxID=31220 RepID=A0AAN9AN13_9CAEN